MIRHALYLVAMFALQGQKVRLTGFLVGAQKLQSIADPVLYYNDIKA